MHGTTKIHVKHPRELRNQQDKTLVAWTDHLGKNSRSCTTPTFRVRVRSFVIFLRSTVNPTPRRRCWNLPPPSDCRRKTCLNVTPRHRGCVLLLGRAARPRPAPVRCVVSPGPHLLGAFFPIPFLVVLALQLFRCRNLARSRIPHALRKSPAAKNLPVEVWCPPSLAILAARAVFRLVSGGGDTNQ